MTGQELRDTRLALGLTQAELGKLLGVARRTVQDWERGVYPVSQTAVLLLATLKPRIVTEKIIKKKRGRPEKPIDQRTVPVHI